MTKETNTQQEMEQGNFKNLFEYYQFTKKDEKAYPVVSRILKQLTPEGDEGKALIFTFAPTSSGLGE